MDVIRTLMSWLAQALRIAVPVIIAAAILVCARTTSPLEYNLVLGAIIGAGAIWVVVHSLNQPHDRHVKPPAATPDDTSESN